MISETKWSGLTSQLSWYGREFCFSRVWRRQRWNVYLVSGIRNHLIQFWTIWFTAKLTNHQINNFCDHMHFANYYPSYTFTVYWTMHYQLNRIYNIQWHEGIERSDSFVCRNQCLSQNIMILVEIQTHDPLKMRWKCQPWHYWHYFLPDILKKVS
jgi:hypothetical protein